MSTFDTPSTDFTLPLLLRYFVWLRGKVVTIERVVRSSTRSPLDKLYWISNLGPPIESILPAPYLQADGAPSSINLLTNGSSPDSDTTLMDPSAYTSRTIWKQGESTEGSTGNLVTTPLFS